MLFSSNDRILEFENNSILVGMTIAVLLACNECNFSVPIKNHNVQPIQEIILVFGNRKYRMVDSSLDLSIIGLVFV